MSGAVSAHRDEKERALRQRSDMQAQLLELSAAHQAVTTREAALQDKLKELGVVGGERETAEQELAVVAGRQESDLALLGAENTRLRTQVADTEEEMDTLIAECSQLKDELVVARRSLSALKGGDVMEAAEAKALAGMRRHNKSTSKEVSRLLARVAELEERNQT